MGEDASSKDEVATSKQAEPDADPAKDAVALSAVEGAVADVKHEETVVEAPEDATLPNKGGSLVAFVGCALAVMIVVALAFGVTRYREATYVSPYKMAAASAYMDGTTRENFLEMMA